MLKCSYYCCIQHGPQNGEGLALAGVNDFCIGTYVRQEPVNSLADRVKIKTGLGNDCTSTRDLAGQG